MSIKHPKGWNTVWNKRNVERELSRINQRMDAAEGGNARTKLSVLLRRAQELESDLSPKAQLERLIAIFSCLVHHLHRGGLNRTQVHTLAKVAKAILLTQGIEPTVSHLSYLYGYLHLVLSHIYRKQGELWKSSWEHHLSQYFSQARSAGSKGFQHLLQGFRALRLGYAELAHNEQKKAELNGLSEKEMARSKLERIKAFRLSGDLERAETLDHEYSFSVPKSMQSPEFSWEKLCRQAQRTGNLLPLVQSIQSGKHHHDPCYVVETFLWQRAVKTREWLIRFPRIKDLATSDTFRLGDYGFGFRAAKVLENCYDREIALASRFEKLGFILTNTGRLNGIETELLVWAAAARWLFRIKNAPMGDLVLAKYCGLSLELSSGRTKDVLGVASDLLSAEEQTEGIYPRVVVHNRG